MNQEHCIHFDYSLEVATPILPSESYSGDDGSSYKEVDEQA